MFRKIFFICIVVLYGVPGHSQEKESCTDLAKLTCEHKDSIQAEKKYNEFLEQVKSRYVDALDEGSKKYALKTFLKKTGMARPSACVTDKISITCHEALKKEMVETATEVSNQVLGKPSKYSDPNVPRQEILFGLFEGISLQVSKELMEQKKSQIKRVEKQFKNVKAAMIRNISKQLNDPSKSDLVKRVTAIEFDSELCASSNYTADFFLVASAFYEPKPHTFSACPRLLLSSMTDTQLSFMIGHEMSHSIDPCRAAETVGNPDKKKFMPVVKYSPAKDHASIDLDNHPYGQQLKCLRGRQSAAAQKDAVTDEELQELKRQKMDPLTYELCAKDQINESFADWMGIEAAVESLRESQKGQSPSQLDAEYASVFSTKCNDVEPGFDVHPSVDRRANGILGVNPQVRNVLKCQNKDTKNMYCQPPRATGTTMNASEQKSEKAGAIR
jgi:hypothetical protein